jgi:hypothetical protein
MERSGERLLPDGIERTLGKINTQTKNLFLSNRINFTHEY